MKKKSVKCGDKYSYLTIISEVFDEKGKSPDGRRRFSCKCQCGKLLECDLADLDKSKKKGLDKSCGCIMLSKITKHKESGTKLYNSWCRMNGRAKMRGSSCNVHPEWASDFESFKRWATSNGYREGLDLCRNGDVGDYEPNNCRWDTRGNNSTECHAENWIVTLPDGSVEKVYNLSEFCKVHNLDLSNMVKTSKGLQKKSKGYSCKKEVL